MVWAHQDSMSTCPQCRFFSLQDYHVLCQILQCDGSIYYAASESEVTSVCHSVRNPVDSKFMDCPITWDGRHVEVGACGGEGKLEIGQTRAELMWLSQVYAAPFVKHQ